VADKQIRLDHIGTDADRCPMVARMAVDKKGDRIRAKFPAASVAALKIHRRDPPQADATFLSQLPVIPKMDFAKNVAQPSRLCSGCGATRRVIFHPLWVRRSLTNDCPSKKREPWVPPSSGAASPRELVGDETSRERSPPPDPVKTALYHISMRGVSEPITPTSSPASLLCLRVAPGVALKIFGEFS